MFGWVRKKIGNWATDSQRDEMQRFVTSLRGQSAEELGMVLLMATIVRQTVGNKTLPATLLEGLQGGTDEELFAPLQLNRLIRQLQKQGSLPQAAGAMVWLHSVRAIITPELRLLGRQMWAELARGIDQVNVARLDLMLLTRAPISPDVSMAANYIPTPLMPLT